ncbi:MAG: hypothetical protein WA997_20380 [Anaerolineales bacterium]|nr:hypothetical protein [Anaerolineales bacterium]HUV26706.1 hypothetical protein [Anaerolineales bacterium]
MHTEPGIQQQFSLTVRTVMLNGLPAVQAKARFFGVFSLAMWAFHNFDNPLIQ